MQPLRYMTECRLLSLAFAPSRRLNRAALFGRQLLEVQRKRIFNDLPCGALFYGRHCLQSASHGGPDRHEQLRIVANPLRLPFLSRSFRGASYAFTRLFAHRLNYITNCLKFVI